MATDRISGIEAALGLTGDKPSEGLPVSDIQDALSTGEGVSFPSQEAMPGAFETGVSKVGEVAKAASEYTAGQLVNTADLALTLGGGAVAWMMEQPVKGILHAQNLFAAPGYERTTEDIDRETHEMIGSKFYQPGALADLTRELTGAEAPILDQAQETARIVSEGIDYYLTPSKMAGAEAGRIAERVAGPAAGAFVQWGTQLSGELFQFGAVHTAFERIKAGKPLKAEEINRVGEDLADIEAGEEIQRLVNEANREVWNKIEAQAAAEQAAPSKFVEEQAAIMKEDLALAGDYELGDITAAGFEGQYSLPNVSTVMRRSGEEIRARTNPEAQNAFNQARVLEESMKGDYKSEVELAGERPIELTDQRQPPVPDLDVRAEMAASDVAIERTRAQRLQEAEHVIIRDQQFEATRKNIESQEHNRHARGNIARLNELAPKPPTVEARQSIREAETGVEADIVDTNSKIAKPEKAEPVRNKAEEPVAESNSPEAIVEQVPGLRYDGVWSPGAGFPDMHQITISKEMNHPAAGSTINVEMEGFSLGKLNEVLAEKATQFGGETPVAEPLRPKPVQRAKPVDTLEGLTDKYAEEGHIFMAQELPSGITLHSLGVSPTARGKGVGTEIMRDLITYADNANKPIRLRAENNSEPFYERFGFEVTDGNVMVRQVGGGLRKSVELADFKSSMTSGKLPKNDANKMEMLSQLDEVKGELSGSEYNMYQKQIDRMPTQEGQRVKRARDVQDARISSEVLRDKTLDTLQVEIAPGLKKWFAGDNSIAIDKLEARIRDMANTMNPVPSKVNPIYSDAIARIDEVLTNISKEKLNRMSPEKKLQLEKSLQEDTVPEVSSDEVLVEYAPDEADPGAVAIEKPPGDRRAEVSEADIDAVYDRLTSRQEELAAGETPTEKAPEFDRKLLDAYEDEVSYIDDAAETPQDLYKHTDSPEAKVEWFSEESDIDYGLENSQSIFKDLVDILDNERGSLNFENPGPEMLQHLARIKAKSAKVGKSLYDSLIEMGIRPWDAEQMAKKYDDSNLVDKPSRSAYRPTGKTADKIAGNVTEGTTRANVGIRDAIRDTYRVLFEKNRIVDDYVKGELKHPTRQEPTINDILTPEVLEGAGDIKFRTGESPHNMFRKMFDIDNSPVFDALESWMGYLRNTQNMTQWSKDMKRQIPSSYERLQTELFPIYEKYSSLLDNKRINSNEARTLRETLKKTSKSNKHRVNSLKKKLSSNLEANKKLNEEFKELTAEYDAQLPELAAKEPSVRVTLEAAGQLPEGIKLAPNEQRLADGMRGYFEATRDKLIDLGIPAITDRPYMTHLWKQLVEGPRTEEHFKAFFKGNKRAPTVLKYMSQMPNSRIWIPDMHTILDAYIPTAERKIAYQPFLNRWSMFIEGQKYPNMSNYMREWVNTNLYRPSEGLAEKVLNAAVAFEYTRLIGLSLSVGLKHLMKLSGTVSKYGFGPTAKGIVAASKIPVQAAMKKLGYTTEAQELKLYRAYVTQRALVRALDELPTIKAAAYKAKSYLAQPTVAIEALDNGVSVMSGIIAAGKKGIGPESAQNMIWETILDANFRGGWDQPLWSKKTLPRAMTMFQMTPWKLAELKYQLVSRAIKGERDAFGTKYSSMLIRYLAVMGFAETIARHNNTSILEMFLHLPFFKHFIHTKPIGEGIAGSGYELQLPAAAGSPINDLFYQIAKEKDIVAGASKHLQYWGLGSKLYDVNKRHYPTGYYETPTKQLFGLPKIDPQRGGGRRRGPTRRRQVQR